MPPTPDSSDMTGPSDDASVYGLTAVAPVRFKAACPECRAHFELPADAFLLAIGASRRTTTYSFACPACETSVRKPAGSGSWNCSSRAASGRCGCTRSAAARRPPHPRRAPPARAADARH